MVKLTRSFLLVLIGVIGLLVVAFILVRSNASKTNLGPQLQETSREGGVDSAGQNEKDETGSRYITFTTGVLEANLAKKRVLFFYANWCPTCRPADASFMQNTSKIPEDIVLVRVNYNDSDTDQEEKDLAAKYGVTYQHTFVQIDANGEQVAKWNGGQIDDLLAKIK